MNFLKQHIPGFAYNGEKHAVWEFDKVEDLKNIKFVKSFVDDGYTLCNSDCRGLLVGFNESNEKMWVIGHLKQPIDGLPTLIVGGDETGRSYRRLVKADKNV